MIWIIGGTGESSRLSQRIQDLDGVIFTVATEEALEFNRAQKVHVGRMDLEEMAAFARDHQVDLIVDMSHPFARVVSANAKKLAQDKGLAYVRYQRGQASREEGALYLDSYEACQDYLRGLKRGRVLFTTGSKGIRDFEGVRGGKRFIYRILPMAKSMEAAREAGVEMKNILGMLGPFSVAMNQALIREYQIDYLVTKDSGADSGFKEKLEACRLEGIQALVIKRQEEEGVQSLEDLEAIIRRAHGTFPPFF
ncbi:MAG: precorrin-6A reductase [Tissierellia bacterium]|nr:precorrin-6A reductase [Tissierellia bacterium]